MTRTHLAMAIAIATALVFASTAAGQDTAGVGVIRGAVTTASGEAVAEVGVCVAAMSRCAVSDERGQFVITDLRPDTYTIEIVSAGRPPLSSTVSVRAGLDAVLEVVLPDAAAIDEQVTVTAPVFVAGEEVKTSGFLASGSEVLQSAGALQDVSRFVQTLPGVAIGTDDFRNDLIVRGGSPLENLYIVDNVEVPNINTFANFASAGGTVSMIDAALLQDVTFLSGGFPSVYGNRASSVLQLSLREGDRQRVGGRVTFGFAGAGAIVEGPLASGRGSFVVSTRRSVLDLVTDDTGIGGVPVLYTVNAKVLFDVSARDRIWVLNLSGVDRIRLGATADSDLTSELSNLDITYHGTRHATGFNWQRLFGDRGVGLFGVNYARAGVEQRVADLIRGEVPPADVPIGDQIANAAEVFRESSSEADLTVKYDLTTATAVGKLQAGAYGRRTTTDYDAASPFGNESPFFPTPETNPFALNDRRVTGSAGTYAQLSRTLVRRLGVTAGVRGDYFGALSALRLSPRVGASVDVTPTLSLRASAGQYFQQPSLLFLLAFPENEELSPIRADHVVAGLSITPNRTTRFTFEGYRKQYRDYPVSTDIGQLSLANVGDTFAVRDVLFPMISAGRGEAYGIEAFAERKPSAGASWYGQANVALSRSRYSGRDGVLRPGSFDYPIVVNATGARRLTAAWDVSGRVVWLGARPYTPFDEAASSAARRGIYDLERVNAERAPVYIRADVRVGEQRPRAIDLRRCAERDRP